MRHSIASRTCLSLILILLPVAAVAQDPGSLSGTAADLGGDGLAGASVLVQGTAHYAITGADGEYSIADIAPGTYVVECFLDGFKTDDVEVTIQPGAAATADCTLELDLLNLDSIVVTGTLNPLSKIESSVAITSKDAEEIREKAPLNTAQMLEVIPGFWAESSGGEGGNNLFARGIPQDGSFRYVAMHEDGLPIYESPELAFTNIDLLFRIDETVEVMEAVRGGSSSIFASNAPGGIINFVTRSGTDVPQGLIKFTLGDYDLFRTDINYGGPLGEDWRFNVGGFYRFDNGIRDPDFPANRGGQFRASLTRLFDNGFLRFNTKYLEERNIFYLPIPLQDPDNPKGIPGFDPNFGTMTSNDASKFIIPTPPFGAVQEYNLKDGMHPEIFQLGGEIDLELGGGWRVRDTFRFMEADIQFNAIFSLDNPFDAEVFAAGCFDPDFVGCDASGVAGATSVRYRYVNFPDIGFDPAGANGNGLVAKVGWWFVDKPLDNFSNDLRLTKSWDRNSFTAGLYFSDFSANEFWTFNTILTEVRDAPRMLDLEILDAAGDEIAQVTANGVFSWGDLYVNASHNGYLYAFYFNDEWQATDKLRIDIGFRYEEAEFSGASEQAIDFDLSDRLAEVAEFDLPVLADDSISWGTGQFIPYNFDFDETAWSVGLNYNFKPGFSLYGRVSDAFRMPDFEQWTFAPRDQGIVEDVFQVEGGIKISSPKLGVFAGIFQSQFDNVRFEDEQIDPQTGQLTRFVRFADTETIGIEAEIIWAPAPGWQLSFTATVQEPEFDNFVQSVFNPNTGQIETIDFSGNQVRRIPKEIFNFRPSYTRGPWRVFASWFYGGKRFTDQANTADLPAYDKIDAGVVYSFPKVELQLTGTNLSNEIGLTEGNPRTGQLIGVQQDIYMARPILGRAWRLSAAYKF